MWSLRLEADVQFQVIKADRTEVHIRFDVFLQERKVFKSVSRTIEGMRMGMRIDLV